MTGGSRAVFGNGFSSPWDQVSCGFFLNLETGGAE